MTGRCGSGQKLSDHIFNHTHEAEGVNWEWGEAIKPTKCTPSDGLPPARLYPQTYLNSATKWGPNVQIPEIMKAILIQTLTQPFLPGQARAPTRSRGLDHPFISFLSSGVLYRVPATLGTLPASVMF